MEMYGNGALIGLMLSFMSTLSPKTLVDQHQERTTRFVEGQHPMRISNALHASEGSRRVMGRQHLAMRDASRALVTLDCE